jgi:hypothetical protein
MPHFMTRQVKTSRPQPQQQKYVAHSGYRISRQLHHPHCDSSYEDLPRLERLSGLRREGFLKKEAFETLVAAPLEATAGFNEQRQRE